MIDLHCHMLPGIDDGSPDEATSLEMARIAVADGIETTACTPHIYPGLYENDAEGIKTRVKALQARLVEEGIALKLTIGADAHLTPELLGRLRAGTAPSLAGPILQPDLPIQPRLAAPGIVPTLAFFDPAADVGDGIINMST